MSYRKISNIALFLFFILYPALSWCQYTQTVMEVGSGISNSSQSKTLNLGLQESVFGALKNRAIVGGWIDNNTNKSSSILVSGQMGFEVDREGLIGGIFFGPGMISNSDSLLGGWFQFVSDIHFGIQDKNDNYFGIFYRHISSGGLEVPNIGRDHIGVELRF